MERREAQLKQMEEELEAARVTIAGLQEGELYRALQAQPRREAEAIKILEWEVKEKERAISILEEEKR